ncbi:hypothetical protein NLJ89_g4599 [Agrocybe chaxingu]|uniref:Signal recognition particle subunit SRP72 n=1 Tax=Agrocybe chaxingu TaxID=84603 RepID=A0A9W8K2S1_9AGAR|nr:hypothetical protein NLJ89_g4599 [Agrocybe chaxingu]
MAPKSSAKDTKHPTSIGKPNWKDHKSTPKQPLSSQERLKRLFTSLCAQIDGGHFGNAVKTCDKILRLEPQDVDARQTKLFLLLQTEQYNAALDLINSNDDKDQHAYERAYCLYRLQREAEARETLEVIKKQKGDDDRGISYREGSYQDAFELYNQLLDTAEPNSEEHSDILTNVQAAQKHLDFIDTGFLHAVDALPSSIISTLQSAPPPVRQQTSAASTLVSASTISKTPADNQDNKPAPKNVRMKRVPAGVIPGVTPPPDPERWLKKSERSSFHQGKRRRGGGSGGATQGSATVENVPPQTGGGSHSSKGVGGKGKKKR